MPISDLVAHVAPVQCFRGEAQIGSGSGFFYIHNEQLLLVTNRHVLIDEEDDHFPDHIRLLLHLDQNDIRRNEVLSTPLYSDENPIWLEHPNHGKAIDVIALPLDKDEIESRFFVRAFSISNQVPGDLDVGIGEDVLVIGYPLGFHDTMHNLPIIRSATLASVYPVPFQGRPVVLIDSRLHRGTSGSPVVTKPSQIIRKLDGSTSFLSNTVSFLVGVHSASIDVLDRDPDVDEPLGLNLVWFASLLPEIINQ